MSAPEAPRTWARPGGGARLGRKELIGRSDAGSTWCPSGTEVSAHNFPSDTQCKAVPYGLDDVLANRGHVVAGT